MGSDRNPTQRNTWLITDGEGACLGQKTKCKREGETGKDRRQEQEEKEKQEKEKGEEKEEGQDRRNRHRQPGQARQDTGRLERLLRWQQAQIGRLQKGLDQAQLQQPQCSLQESEGSRVQGEGVRAGIDKEAEASLALEGEGVTAEGIGNGEGNRATDDQVERAWEPV
jgi:hypothetical protein